jgi:hypothetical protein
MTARARLTVVYGRDADAYSVARDADRALEGSGAHVWYDSDADTVWITGRNRAIADAVRFEPGQTLVVGAHGRWWIKDAAGPEVAA